jgi:hypothetical protein
MTLHIVADSTIVLGILENMGVAFEIIFLSYTSAKIEGVRRNLPLGSTPMRESLEHPWVNSRAANAFDTPTLGQLGGRVQLPYSPS